MENNNFIFNLFDKNGSYRKNNNQNKKNKDEFFSMSESKCYLMDETSISPFNENLESFRFITTSMFEVNLLIEKNKTIKELIMLYFKKINRLDLFGNKDIGFIYNAKSLPHDSKELIKNLFKINGKKTVLVIDQMNQIMHKIL